MSFSQYYMLAKRTWILYTEFSMGHNIQSPMSTIWPIHSTDCSVCAFFCVAPRARYFRTPLALSSTPFKKNRQFLPWPVIQGPPLKGLSTGLPVLLWQAFQRTALFKDRITNKFMTRQVFWHQITLPGTSM